MKGIIMRVIASIFTIGLVLCAPVIWGQTSDSPAGAVAEGEVLETQTRRFQAMMDVDLEALNAIAGSPVVSEGRTHSGSGRR